MKRHDRRPPPGPRLRINDMIRVSPLRVIGVDGEMLGVMPREEAFRQAREAGVDIVEISPTAVPPVCKLMDYGKFKYEEKKRQQKAKAKQHTMTVKEVRLRPKTDKHDVETKLKKAKQFLKDGDKVAFTVMFRGREVTHPEIPLKILEHMMEDLKEIARIEKEPSIEGRRMTMIVTPK